MRIHRTCLSSHAWDFDPADPAWPDCLEELPDPPRRLRVAGHLPFLDRAIAIVGTRRASADGLALARRIARDLSLAGCVVVSGGAEGIDAAAHEGALEGGGLGIAVLAGGLARPFPRAHAPLFERIAENGAVVSEADDDDDPRAHLFLARNRLIAALARAVIVVQAPVRSGALSTAAHARALGRPLLCVPWAIGDARGEGGVALLASGAARACRDAADVIEAVTGEPRPRAARASRARAPQLDGDQRVIWEALRASPAHVDELVRTTGLPAARVQITLTTLTLMGMAEPDDRGAFRRIR
jgi:DNA processing protein